MRPANADTDNDAAPRPRARTRVALPATPQAQAAVAVVARLREAGHAAYLVGGCVRDLVLGAVPKDYDVATAAAPDVVTALFARVVPVGAAFGVVRVLAAAGVEVEVATFRADLGYADGRRPVAVRFTDAREDVLRRDFTLNGLLADPLDADGAAASEAEVVDWVGGIDDLRAHKLRAIGAPHDRFAEDGLRLLRAVRFAARFGLEIEPSTSDAMVAMADGLLNVSPERVTAELVGMLRPPFASRAVALLASHGLAARLFPELAAIDPGLAAAETRFEALVASAEPAPAAVVDGFAPSRGIEPGLAFAALLWDIRPADERAAVARVGAALRLANATVRAMASCWRVAAAIAARVDDARAAAAPLPAADAGDARLARLLRDDHADAGLRLYASTVAAGADGGGGALRDWINGLRALRAQTPRARWWPEPYVDGRVLLGWGATPGPRLRAALDAALDAQLGGLGREDAEAAARAVLADASPD